MFVFKKLLVILLYCTYCNVKKWNILGIMFFYIPHQQKVKHFGNHVFLYTAPTKVKHFGNHVFFLPKRSYTTLTTGLFAQKNHILSYEHSLATRPIRACISLRNSSLWFNNNLLKNKAFKFDIKKPLHFKMIKNDDYHYL